MPSSQRKKEKKDNPREGWEDGTSHVIRPAGCASQLPGPGCEVTDCTPSAPSARRHHTGILRRGVWCARALAVAHPWASASSYLSSQSLSDSRCNLHATSRSSHSRRSPSCRFILCRVTLLCLVLWPVPPLSADPLVSRLLLGATPPSSRHILAPRVYRALLAQGRLSDAHSDHYQSVSHDSAGEPSFLLG